MPCNAAPCAAAGAVSAADPRHTHTLRPPHTRPAAAIYSQSGTSAGVGFAIPVDVVKSSVEQARRGRCAWLLPQPLLPLPPTLSPPHGALLSLSTSLTSQPCVPLRPSRRSSSTARWSAPSWASASRPTSRVRCRAGHGRGAELSPPGWQRELAARDGTPPSAQLTSPPALRPAPLPARLPARPAVEQLGVNGVLVLNAREGGPAAKAGVRGSTRDEYGR